MKEKERQQKKGESLMVYGEKRENVQRQVDSTQPNYPVIIREKKSHCCSTYS